MWANVNYKSDFDNEYISEEEIKKTAIQELLEELNLEPDENWIIVIEKANGNKKDIIIKLWKDSLDDIITTLKSNRTKQILKSNKNKTKPETTKINNRLRRYIKPIKKEIHIIIDDSQDICEVLKKWKELLNEKLEEEKLNQEEIKLVKELVENIVYSKFNSVKVEK